LFLKAIRFGVFGLYVLLIIYLGLLFFQKSESPVVHLCEEELPILTILGFGIELVGF